MDCRARQFSGFSVGCLLGNGSEPEFARHQYKLPSIWSFHRRRLSKRRALRSRELAAFRTIRVSFIKSSPAPEHSAPLLGVISSRRTTATTVGPQFDGRCSCDAFGGARRASAHGGRRPARADTVIRIRLRYDNFACGGCLSGGTLFGRGPSRATQPSVGRLRPAPAGLFRRETNPLAGWGRRRGSRNFSERFRCLARKPRDLLW